MKFALVENEYIKFPDLNTEDIQKLKVWMIQQPHLPNVTDLEIILFLHSCYYSIEQTKQTIDTYYTIRTHSPEFFSKRDILGEDMIKCSNVVMFAQLPKPTYEGYKIMYCKLVNSDTSKFVLADCIKLLAFSLDLMLMENGTTKGLIILIDMDGVTLGHVAKMGLITMKKFLYFLQESLPVRLKGLHFMNIVPFMDKILGLMRPFMKKELIDVLHLHTSNDKELFSFIPQEVLPKNYGGSAETIENLHKSSFNHTKEFREYFIEEEKTRRVNELSRPGKPKTSGDLFGVDGNFKQLGFD